MLDVPSYDVWDLTTPCSAKLLVFFFIHLRLEWLTQFLTSNDKKYLYIYEEQNLLSIYHMFRQTSVVFYLASNLLAKYL